MIDLLYIHPFSGLLDNLIVPTGVIPLVNRVNCSKRGLFWFEVNDRDIANSRIIALDLHWFYSLYPVRRLCAKIKKINPAIKIILGGYTATLFAGILISELECDYIIKGDADHTFPLLVDNILNGCVSSDVPNLVARSFSTPFAYSLDGSGFDKCDYLNVDWFPSFKKGRSQYSLYGCRTFIQAVKGCINNCEGCYGNNYFQSLLCNRGLIKRSAGSIRKEIRHYSNAKEISCIQIHSDFINIFGLSELEEIFSERYDLELFYVFEKFYDNPAVYRLLARSFKKVRIFLPVYDIQEGRKIPIPAERLENLLKQSRELENIALVLVLSDNIPRELKSYLKANDRNLRNVFLRFGSDFLIDVPAPQDSYADLYKEYIRCLKASKHKFYDVRFRLAVFFYKLKEEDPRIGSLMRGIYYYAHKQVLFNFFRFKKLRHFLFCYC